ncbi:hypothetical protein SISNIDRAFT_547059 [Sistotremastrum niveocremeum HHB9708]|uniref:Uncharacterized protein n=2 Tax=Sistotremastraceae TaxID=3402574 RepID=A0A164ZTL1_9AGAM|nr:hypothetical protein SISNIDRAFT_547059 [Sistotremastrum niveocremeum HHB9708]KZT38340.1 hypothetical protein SISSUDRAFT_1119693 [Sistotremastrum suecicum HHB10207 ss-3]
MSSVNTSADSFSSETTAVASSSTYGREDALADSTRVESPVETYENEYGEQVPVEGHVDRSWTTGGVVDHTGPSCIDKIQGSTLEAVGKLTNDQETIDKGTDRKVKGSAHA